MDLFLSGKKALVTGAGRGIGKAICESLARENVSIAAVARTRSDLDALGESLPSLKRYAKDLSSEKEVDALIEELIREDHEPDIIVHNVGGNLGVTEPLCTVADWKSVMRINIEIPIQINRVFIPKMQQKQWGRICHISSIAGLENQGPPPYCAAKAAMIAYVRSMGRFVAKDHVILTSVLPGAVLTQGGYWDVAAKERPDHVSKYLKDRMAIQRFGEPKEISELVTFLCSEHASFCVGSAFLADGGQGRVFYNQSEI